MEFERWLGTMFGRDELDARRVLQDQSALQFLIAWSFFEAKCFDGFVKIEKLKAFSSRLLAEGFSAERVAEQLGHFHARYQDAELYRQLMHKQNCSRMALLVLAKAPPLEPVDQVFFVAMVAYRFRNNMFHGNKGVQSWLRYRQQIDLCTKALQAFVTHAESMQPSIAARDVA